MVHDILKFLVPLLIKCVQQVASLAKVEQPAQQDPAMYSPRRTPRFNLMDEDDMFFRDNMSYMSSSSPRLNKRCTSPIFGGDATVGFAGVDSSVHQSPLNDSMISDGLEEDFIETRPKRYPRRKTTKTEKRQTKHTLKETPRLNDSFSEFESTPHIKESPLETPEPLVESTQPKKGFFSSLTMGCIIVCALMIIVYGFTNMFSTPPCTYNGPTPMHRLISNESSGMSLSTQVFGPSYLNQENIMAWSSYHYLSETIHFEMRTRNPSKFIVEDCLEQRRIMCHHLGLNCLK